MAMLVIVMVLVLVAEPFRGVLTRCCGFLLLLFFTTQVFWFPFDTRLDGWLDDCAWQDVYESKRERKKGKKKKEKMIDCVVFIR